jgi:hypothetical protein
MVVEIQFLVLSILNTLSFYQKNMRSVALLSSQKKSVVLSLHFLGETVGNLKSLSQDQD